MPDFLNTREEFDECLKNNELVVVDFTASWCGPCRMIGPKFAKLSEEHPDVKFVKVDVDKNSETSEACHISAMPTFHTYKKGEKLGEIVGASEQKLKDLINALKA